MFLDNVENLDTIFEHFRTLQQHTSSSFWYYVSRAGIL